MKKKIIQLTCGMLLFIILIAMYYYGLKNKDNQNNNEANIEEQGSEDGYYTLIDKSNANVESVILKSNNSGIEGNNIISENSVMELINIGENENENWVVKGYEDIEFNQMNMSSIIDKFTLLDDAELISDSVEDLSQFGLNQPVAEATGKYDDRTEVTIYIGNKTPDNNYYYVMTSNEENKVFILHTYTYGIFLSTLNDLINKSLPVISNQSLTYLDIKRKDDYEIEIKLDESNNDNEAKSLIMTKPVEATVIRSALETEILSDTLSLMLQDLIEIYPSDLAKYGLDDPQMIIQMSDTQNNVKISVGNDIDDEYVYCMVNDRPHVFSIRSGSGGLLDFIYADAEEIIERFISYHYKDEIAEIDIEANGKAYNITFEDNTVEETSIDSESDNSSGQTSSQKSFINGKEIEEKAFSDFYDMLLSMEFYDVIDYKGREKEKELTIVINYHLKDGTSEVIKFYDHSESFYAIGKNERVQYMVNKAPIDEVIEFLEYLAK